MPLAFLAIALAAGSPPAAAPAAPDKPQRICRQGEQLVGSHIRTGRRCKTAAEWQAEDARKEAPAPSLRVTEGQNDGLPIPRPQ
ncbi:MAG TPA: hypothetical protein VF027_07415 [Sphingomicrobium sp.]